MRVSQVLCAAGPVDAVTNQAFAWRRQFQSWGWEGADYTAHAAPGIRSGALRPLRELRPAADEVVVLHYSGYARGLESLLEQSSRSLLISHNVTPADYFWDHDPLQAARCQQSLGQLAELARLTSANAAVSEFNAATLRELSGGEVQVIPVLFDRAVLDSGPGTAPAGAVPPGPPTILFVGRMAPHKRQDLVIRAFAHYRRHQPDARLVLIGTALPREREPLEELAGRLAPGAVELETGGISSARLAERYRSAHVFLSLSEHEGFCIPLLEAFHFHVPVAARDAGAIAEVAGDAAILLGAEDGPATVGELLAIMVADQELRGELVARGERRLAAYQAGDTAARMRATLEQLGSVR